MQISIVTLNYNGSTETLKLLKSLKNQTDPNFEIIVIDNASEEADFTNLQDQLIHSFSLPTLNVDNPQGGTVLSPPQVKVVRNSDNLGFSGGNNIGIRHALENGSDWVVLLNNDIWVEKDFIEHLRAVLSPKNPLTSLGQMGVIGIPLIEGGKIAYYGQIQWLKPTLKHAYQLTSPDGKAIEDPRQSRDLPAYQLYAIGGAVVIYKDVFEKIGLLDENYFLYFEDADFSVRVQKAGFDISIAENLSVHHYVSSSTKKLGSPLLLRYHYRNALYFNLKNGPWYVKLAVWPWSVIIVIKQLGKLVINRDKEESKEILAGVTDFYKNKFGKIE
ncbi:MAG: hypothetical protein A3J46_00985 [Candidatus Yanofskybacteria bacterium RIFCSPHIGHO2_02_FULL_41_11]|uniref:Glycosyltransferase 2-like domain-containing protein n=1 Tax=Candidatus Yanofskybacteria bacterium RIFCSPHIGHO2_02_FULL_41_11 TaxID=1802675 RepID=A0A1F8F4Y5_9BACT|nr:MAG: hypothetical protein A3J46_00985 [Candidatus Yanofskybacteria bacterium RIFCSPHIGHO2_02_FULL_41_11]